MIGSIAFRCFFKGRGISCVSAIGFLLVLLATVQTDGHGSAAADYSLAPKQVMAPRYTSEVAIAKLKPYSSSGECCTLFSNKSITVSLYHSCELPCPAEEIDPEYKEFCLAAAEEIAVVSALAEKPGNDRHMRIHGRAANEIYHVPW